MKKITMCLIMFSMLFILIGCSDGNDIKESTNTEIGVNESLLKVEITVPSDFVDEMTQKELNELAIEKGYESITLNEDGSVSYKMTKSKHKKMLKEMSDRFRGQLDEMVASEDYPNFVKIEVNDNFSDFTIRTTSTEVSFFESFSVLGFYMYGETYSAYSGKEIENIYVRFVNDSTGNVLLESDLKDTFESMKD